tara:strand:- start:321 stop:464 length:144 start_codon:yes stop_codon:yes gene_type:complete
MIKKEKNELEKFVKETGYNKKLEDTYMRDVLDENKEFDEEFYIDWEV